ncbi:minor tail protein [Bacillus phage 035JT001]|nr:minor tail protein [Bacillus phage 035JT001]
MALSGTIHKNVGDHWALRLEWSATQDIDANTSRVTARLYWIADEYGHVNSSVTKTASIGIDGTWNSHSASSMASLNDGQKKKIHEFSRTINHASDGTGKVTLDGWFDAKVTLDGVYYGRIELPGTTWNLNTIPRESKLSSSANWTAPNTLSLSISRASSAFTHTVKIYVGGTLIRTETGIGTSRTVTFTTAQNTTIFEKLAQGSSIGTKIEVITYKGSTNIGTTSKTGTVYAPASSTLSVPSSLNVGDTLNGSISRKNSSFVHDVRLYFNSGHYDLMDEGGTSFSFDTDNIADTLYAQMPNANSWKGRIRIWTHYNGVQVQDGRDYYVTFKVVNSNPIFSGVFSYKDTNTTTTAITGNNQEIIQGVSKVLVTIPVANKAEAQNGATMSQYIAILNGVQKTVNYSSTADVTIDFGTITAGADANLTIQAVDSRGNKTSKYKTVHVIPYQPPAISFTADRVNTFEAETIIRARGSYSPLTVGGANKNTIKSLTYSYRPTNVSTEEGSGDIPKTIKGQTITGKQTIIIDNLKSYYVEVKIQDIFNTITVSATVPVGQPLVYYDEYNRSVGFNDFPTAPNQVFMNAQLVFGGNRWGANSGINMQNGDITQLNGLWFNDRANNRGEGLLFPRTDTPEGSTDNTQYDSWYIRDGVVYFNDQVVGVDVFPTLWTGTMYMTGSQTVTPSKKLSQCPTGWILNWSDYDGSGEANPFDNNYTFIPKYHPRISNDQGVYCVLSSGLDQTSSLTMKYVYVTDSQIRGNDRNGETVEKRDIVLRAVFAI